MRGFFTAILDMIPMIHPRYLSVFGTVDSQLVCRSLNGVNPTARSKVIDYW